VTISDDRTERVDIPPDVELEAPFSDDELTPTAARSCTDCAGVFLPLDNETAPPGSYAEAWRPPVICRGTIDPQIHRWCKVTGTLTMPNRMEVRFFPDRRKGERRVDHDRRRPGPPPFPPRKDGE